MTKLLALPRWAAAQAIKAGAGRLAAFLLAAALAGGAGVLVADAAGADVFDGAPQVVPVFVAEQTDGTYEIVDATQAPNILVQIRDGMVTRAELDAAVSTILAAIAAHEHDPPPVDPPGQGGYDSADRARDDCVARWTAGESVNCAR